MRFKKFNSSNLNVSEFDSNIQWFEELVEFCNHLIYIKENHFSKYSVIDDYELLFSVLPSDDYSDIPYMLEDVFYNFEDVSVKELYKLLKNIIKEMKRVHLTVQKYYEKIIIYPDYVDLNDVQYFEYQDTEYIDFGYEEKKLIVGESFEEIDSLIKSMKYIFRTEYALQRCEERLVKFIENRTDLMTRAEIEDYTGYKPILYKFLKPQYVLDFKGMYLNSQALKISDVDKEILKDIIYRHINKNKIINIDNIYIEVCEKLLGFINGNRIYTSYALFSVTNFLFISDFEFSRPYIYKKGMPLYSRNEMIDRYVLSNSRTNISDLKQYVDNLDLTTMSLINMVDSMNDKVIFENKSSLVKLNALDFTYSDFEEIEEAILEELLKNESTCAIVDLYCTYDFKQFSFEWDEWFIYSVLKKWSNKIFVKVTSRNFDYAVPVVSLYDDIEQYELDFIQHNRINKTIVKRKYDIDLETVEIDYSSINLFGLEFDL